MYNKNGECTKRSCPTLGGESISSIIIHGDYVVSLAYLSKNFNPTTNPIADSCEEFPTANDVNKLGPYQIKWENIRNYNGLIPTDVMIIPVKD
jgi:hypothetical protein